MSSARGHLLVHQLGVVSLHIVRLVTVAAQQLIELLMGDPREHGRVRDLVAVQVQDWEHGAVVHGVEELVGVPAGGERAGFGLAVADDTGHEQIGIVEGRAVGV